MKTTIDATGRVLIPSSVRRRASLAAGTVLEASWDGEQIVLTPRAMEARVVKRGRFFVAEPAEPLPALSASVVQSEIDDVRSRARGARRGGSGGQRDR